MPAVRSFSSRTGPLRRISVLVMSHELTHALQDQHFHIDQWSDAAKPNDDAELARDAVIEGSAMAAMLDYQLGGKGSIRDLGDFDPSLLMGDPDGSPELSKAPKVLQDELLFPYLAGTKFTQKVLQASNGWPDFHKVFENPPLSTQQIMHPDMYLQGVAPPKIKLPATAGLISADWKELDENDMGEFGVLEIFKQFLPKDRAGDLAATWSADRYALFENQKNKRTMLLFDIRLASDADAARFFGAYSEVLELKYDHRTNLLRRPNFFSFDTPEDGVFVRCMGTDCLVLEGGSRLMFDHLTHGNGMAQRSARANKTGRITHQSDCVSDLPRLGCRCRSAQAAHGTVSHIAIALHARACTLGGGGPNSEARYRTASKPSKDHKAKFPVRSFARVPHT